jgi:hypothetical protein
LIDLPELSQDHRLTHILQRPRLQSITFYGSRQPVYIYTYVFARSFFFIIIISESARVQIAVSEAHVYRGNRMGMALVGCFKPLLFRCDATHSSRTHYAPTISVSSGLCLCPSMPHLSPCSRHFLFVKASRREKTSRGCPQLPGSSPMLLDLCLGVQLFQLLPRT